MKCVHVLLKFLSHPLPEVKEQTYNTVKQVIKVRSQVKASLKNQKTYIINKSHGELSAWAQRIIKLVPGMVIKFWTNWYLLEQFNSSKVLCYQVMIEPTRIWLI